VADLTTLERVKQYAGIDSTDVAADAILSRLITAKSRWFEEQIDRRLLRATYTETRSGYNTTRIYPTQYPVASVASVKIDGATIPPRTAYGQLGWALADNRIELVGYTFTRGVGNVEIVYDAGYETVPEDVEQALIERVVLSFKRKDNLGAGQVSVQGETVQFSDAGTIADIASVIDKYRRPVVG
jgi:hypothetical protein